MPERRTCPECGALLSSDAPLGLCLKCLGRQVDQGENTRKLANIGLPRAFGDYELLEEIGRGGMGVVYKARQRSLNRTVAIKMLLAGPLANLASVGRFRSEAEAAAQLRHPNIATVYEIGEQEGCLYFSMDYVPGVSLTDLAQHQPLPIKDAACLVKTLAEIIQFAHDRGTIHRDLKPSNIVIDEKGEPHVMDFGLAKRVEAHVDHTLSGQSLGSPGYAPPEQVDGKRGRMGPWSDVYGLGAILYFLLTGRPPFVGSSLTDVLFQTLHSKPIPPRSLNREVSPKLQTICHKCLEKDSVKRYSSAKELATDLEAFSKNQPEPMSRWRKHQSAPLIVAGSTIAIVGLLVWLVLNAAQFSRAREKAHNESSDLASQTTPSHPKPESLVSKSNAPLLSLAWAEYADNGDVSINGVVHGATLPLMWNWGDGTTNQSNFPAKHKYAANGQYTVIVTASSNSGEIKTQSRVVQIKSTGIYVISDPTGNLSGDHGRTFLDVTNIFIRNIGENYQFEVSVVGGLPTPQEMTEGRKIDFIWIVDADRSTNTFQFPNLGNDYNIHVTLNENGWQTQWVKVSELSVNDNILIDPKVFKIQAGSNHVALLFPKSYLPTRSFDLELDASNQNSRNWLPITRNPLTQRTTISYAE